MPAGSMIRTASGSSHLRARSEYRLMPEAWCAACTVDVCIVSRPHERTCERCFVFVHYLYAQHSLLRTRLYSQVSSLHPVGTPVGIPPLEPTSPYLRRIDALRACSEEQTRAVRLALSESIGPHRGGGHILMSTHMSSPCLLRSRAFSSRLFLSAGWGCA